MRKPGYRWIAGIAATLAGAVITVSASCGGTTVFDAPDPKACGTGHGCPMVGCACADGSAVFDTTCELGECRAIQDVCDERCAEFEGPLVAIGTLDDEVAIPDCETFCTRLLVNGCELGCDTLFSDCLKPSRCSQAAQRFWNCATQEAVLTCEATAGLASSAALSGGLAVCDK